MSKQKRQDKECLSDIREAMQRIVAYTAELSHEQFMNDMKTQDAVVRNLVQPPAQGKSSYSLEGDGRHER